jgi:hypothetical protein
LKEAEEREEPAVQLEIIETDDEDEDEIVPQNAN